MGLKKNNPGCGCCGGSNPCFQCAGETPTEMVLTIAGITDNNCDCSMIDGTYVLSQSTLNPCVYTSGTFAFDTSCYFGSCRGARYWFELIFQGSQIVVAVYIDYSGWSCADGQANYTTLIFAPYDCTAPRTYSYVSALPGSTYPCNGWTTVSIRVEAA